MNRYYRVQSSWLAGTSGALTTQQTLLHSATQETTPPTSPVCGHLGELWGISRYSLKFFLPKIAREQETGFIRSIFELFSPSDCNLLEHGRYSWPTTEASQFPHMDREKFNLNCQHIEQPDVKSIHEVKPSISPQPKTFLTCSCKRSRCQCFPLNESKAADTCGSVAWFVGGNRWESAADWTERGSASANMLSCEQDGGRRMDNESFFTDQKISPELTLKLPSSKKGWKINNVKKKKRP